MRRATGYFGRFAVDPPYFYPRSPCGERRNARPETRRSCAISIHALLAESDAMQVVIVVMHALFLSTLSLRRATAEIAKTSNADTNFYPRSPCGERPPPYNLMIHHAEFLSTLSLRRATSKKSYHLPPTSNFYPRSPCGERRHFISAVVSYNIFLSTLSLRRAPPPFVR